VVDTLTGSFARETTPTSVTTRKSPTMDQGVQTSGGLANNTAGGGGGGGGGMPRGQRGGGGYVRGGYNGFGYQRAPDNRRYQPQYNTYGRYQQTDIRGGRPPMRGSSAVLCRCDAYYFDGSFLREPLAAVVYLLLF